jgi:phospholipid/cholesterol/gamma-HCH transport system substrate-binding protein
VPALLQRADQALASLQGATKDLAQASARTPSIARNIDAGAADLPALLTQTQLTAQQLEALLTQLRGLWLLGGGDATAAPPRRLSPADLHP